MKQCPKCKQFYRDESLNFCLSDGSNLITVANLSEPTLVMGSSKRTAESEQRNLNTSLPYIIVISVLALIAIGASAAFLMHRTSNPPTERKRQTSIPDNRFTSDVTNSDMAIEATSTQKAVEATSTHKASADRVDEIVVKYPDTKSEPLTWDAVRNIISVWERAQEIKSFASYRSCYDPSFVGVKKTKSGPSETYSYSSWMADRRKMIARSANLNIDLLNLEIRLQGDTAIVEFDQYYRSLSYSDWGPKEIVVKMTPAGPKIVREELKASYPL